MFLSVLVVLCTSIQVFSFHHQRPMMAQNDGKIRSINARPVGLQRSALMAGFLGGLFAKDGANANDNVGKSPTNEVVGVVNGIRQKRLGGTGDIVVSELALGTQRWYTLPLAHLLITHPLTHTLIAHPLITLTHNIPFQTSSYAPSDNNPSHSTPSDNTL